MLGDKHWLMDQSTDDRRFRHVDTWFAIEEGGWAPRIWGVHEAEDRLYEVCSAAINAWWNLVSI